MKFLLVTGKRSTSESRHLVLEEAKKLFETVLSVPLDKIRVECKNGENKLYYKNQDLTQFDVVYVRLFSGDFVFGQIVLDILEASPKVYTPNCVESFQVTNHKYYTVKQLSDVGIPVPATALSVSPESAHHQAHRFGFPVVVKLLSGFGGKGVMLSNSEAEFKPVLDTLKVFKEFICTQEFLETKQGESGSDIRYYVLGEEVFAVKRQSKKGEWRANVSRGGRARQIEVDPKLKKIALKSAQVLGLDVCAVDFIETEEGHRVVEVNFTPGAIIKTFGNKVVKKFVRALHVKGTEAKNVW